MKIDRVGIVIILVLIGIAFFTRADPPVRKQKESVTKVEPRVRGHYIAPPGERTAEQNKNCENARGSLNSDYISYVDGINVYIKPVWYGLTVQQKELTAYMIAGCYFKELFVVRDAYTGKELGRFSTSNGWAIKKSDVGGISK